MGGTEGRCGMRLAQVMRNTGAWTAVPGPLWLFATRILPCEADVFSQSSLMCPQECVRMSPSYVGLEKKDMCGS